MNYNWCGFAFDLGYNLFYRDKEKVTLEGPGCDGVAQFTDSKWAIAARDFSTESNNAPTLAGADLVYRDINTVDLDLNSASTPRLLTHKLFAGVGYWTKTWDVPMLVGVGGHYEFADADIVSNWGFNARLGVGF